MSFSVLLRAISHPRNQAALRPVETTALMWMNWVILSPSEWKHLGCLICGITYHTFSLILFFKLFSSFSVNSVLFLGVASPCSGHHFPSPGKGDIVASLYLDPVSMLCSGLYRGFLGGLPLLTFLYQLLLFCVFVIIVLDTNN